MEEQRNEYRTGRTEPQKKHNGIIAFLLILVIFLSGLVSVMGILNIHLFRLLDEQEGTAPLSFSHQQSQADTQAANGVTLAGMVIEEIPALYQSVHELPAGLYISYVQEDSAAHQAGILAGDVLVSFADMPVSSLDALRPLLTDARDTVTLTVCREEQYLNFTVEVTK